VVDTARYLFGLESAPSEGPASDTAGDAPASTTRVAE
jgi:hypothetical protein